MQLDPDDRLNYEQRQFFDKQTSSEPISGTTIFFAVLGAILTAWFIREAYQRWEAEQALRILNQQMAAIAAQSQENARRIIEQQARVRAEAELQEKLKREEAIRVANDERAMKVAIAEEAARKEKAWQAYYKPIVNCAADNPSREIVLCGNDYARARKKFEAEWQ